METSLLPATGTAIKEGLQRPPAFAGTGPSRFTAFCHTGESNQWGLGLSSGRAQRQGWLGERWAVAHQPSADGNSGPP